MIKFFRKIRQHLLLQYRFGRYLVYALGEIILIMLGILFALQVNNWNALRTDRVQEKVLLKNLLIECKTNYKEIERALNKRESALKGNGKLQRLIDQDEKTISKHEFDSLIGLSRYITTLDPKSGVKNEIVNSGKIELIRNAEIVSFVTEWEAEIENLTKIEDGLSHIVIDQYTPFLIKKLSLRNSNNIILNSFTTVGKERWVNWHPDQNSKFDLDYQEILNEKEFESYISQLTLWRIGAQFYTEELLNKITEIIETLEQELSKK